MKVLVSGSFDPPTLGHVALVRAARTRYGEVTACVMVNADKAALFSLDDRKKMLELALGGMAKTDAYEGTCCDYCAANGIELIVRGYRNAADYAYETEMARYNRTHGGPDTVLLQLDGLEDVKATEARERIVNGGDLTGILPRAVVKYIEALSDREKTPKGEL